MEPVFPSHRYFQSRRNHSFPSPLNINRRRSRQEFALTSLIGQEIKDRRIQRAKELLKQALHPEEIEKRYRYAKRCGDRTYPSPSFLRNIITDEARLREKVILWCHYHGQIKDVGEVSLALLPEDLFREYIIPMIYEFKL